MLKNKIKSLLNSSKTPFLNYRYSLTCYYRTSLISFNYKPFTKSSSSQFMNRHVNDPYVKKAKTVIIYLI